MSNDSPVPMRPSATRPPGLINHVGITVSDLDTAIAFYCDVLGFDPLGGPAELRADDPQAGAIVSDVFGHRFGAARTVWLASAAGTGIELFQFDDPPTEAAPDEPEHWRSGTIHLGLTTADVAELAQRIEAGGGARTSEVWEFFPGAFFCYCRDPWGTVLELSSCSFERFFANRQ